MKDIKKKTKSFNGGQYCIDVLIHGQSPYLYAEGLWYSCTQAWPSAAGVKTKVAGDNRFVLEV